MLPSATPAPRNGPIKRPAVSNLPRDGGLASRQAPVEELRRDTRRDLRAPTSGAENRPLPVRLRHSWAAGRQPNLDGQVAAPNSEAALLPLGLIA
jgi:hypothetical protein